MSINLPIFTSRLIIDEFTPNDLDKLTEIAQNINTNAARFKESGYRPFYAFQTSENDLNGNAIKEKVSAFIAKAEQERSTLNRSTYRLAIRLRDKTLIGNVTIDMLPIEENGKIILGDLGYFINPAYGKQGLSLEAVRAVSSKFFSKYDTLDLTVHPDNIPSKRLISNIGGVKIGEKSQSSYGNAEPRDIYIVNKQDFKKTLQNRVLNLLLETLHAKNTRV